MSHDLGSLLHRGLDFYLRSLTLFGLTLLGLAVTVAREIVALGFLNPVGLVLLDDNIEHAVVDTCVGVILDGDAFLAQEVDQCGEGHIEVPCYFTYFRSRHIMF